MKTIMMTISRGSLIRNFFHTGVVPALLRRGLRVIVLTPHSDDPAFVPYQHQNLIFEPLIESKNLRFNKLFIEIEKGVIFNKTVRTRYRYRVAGRIPSRLYFVFRMFLFAPLSFIPGIKPFFRLVDFHINPERQHDYLIEKYKPDLIFSTSAGGDISVIKGARRLGVRSIDMPKSWDTLPKYLFNVKADHMIVWSDFMKEQSVRAQGYRPEEVIVTGVPQFDFYKDERRFISREIFCKKLGLDPTKKIILYGSTGGNCCDEMAYIKLLRRYMADGILKNVQVLIRPHIGYLGDADRFSEAEHYPGFALDRSGQQGTTFQDRWDTSEEHVNHLVNSFRHAALSINIASTLSLDALAAGIPVININFDVDLNISPHFSTNRLYQSDYIEAVVRSGGTKVVESEQAFRETLARILKEEKRVEKEKEEALRYLIFRADGHSGERLAEAITDLVQ